MQGFTELLNKDVDRREFLLYLGLITIAVLGISGFMKSFSSFTQPKAQKGFGHGGYGM